MTSPVSLNANNAVRTTLQDDILVRAEHSLTHTDMSAALREAFMRSDVKGLMQRFGGENGLSGKALQEKVLAELTAPVDKARRWFEPGACFAKGTLVHTKEGLKAIEEIQVGDWVLSKPENGGEQTYKRVLKTFEHPPERLVRVAYYVPENKPNRYGATAAVLNVTVNHPFFVKELGWTAARELMNYNRADVHFEDVDGNDVDFHTLTRVYISDQPNVGWIPADMGATNSTGALWNYDTHKLINGEALALDAIRETYRDLGDREAIDPDLFFKAPVYNLEVEEFHTYYVGEHGIWVHNQNCNGLNFEARNTKNPLPISDATPSFVSRTELENWFSARGVKSQDDLTQWLRAKGNPDGVIRLKADKPSASGTDIALLVGTTALPAFTRPFGQSPEWLNGKFP